MSILRRQEAANGKVAAQMVKPQAGGHALPVAGSIQKTIEVHVASVAANLGGEGPRIKVRLVFYKPLLEAAYNNHTCSKYTSPFEETFCIEVWGI